MAKTKREARFISDQKKTQISENYAEQRGYYNSIYTIVSRNSNKSITDILKALSIGLNKQFSLEFLNEEIKKMKSINTGRSHECDVIVKLALAKNNNDQANIVRYTGYLQIINERKQIANKRAEQLRNSDRYIRNGATKAYTKKDEAIEFMKKYLNDEVKTNELDSKRAYVLIQELRKNLKEIDPDEYIDFIIKYNNLEVVTDEELKELREVLEYFLKNINNNLMNIKQLDPEIPGNQALIDQIPVAGEDQMNSITKGSARKTYNWKMNKLENKKDFYSNYLEMVNGLLVNRDYNSYKVISANDRKTLCEEYEFLKEYFESFRNIGEAYNPNVNKIKTATDSKINTLRLKFNNKISGIESEE